MTSPSGERAAFLQTVRDRLAGGIPPNHVRAVVPDPTPPPIRYVRQGGGAVVVFTEAAAAVGAVVDHVEDGPAYVAGLCRDRGGRRAVVSNDPECAGVAEAVSGLGVELVAVGDVAGSAAADVGITGAAYGLALTGTLVVDSARAGGRTASLLPPLHVALLRRDAILPDAGALFRRLGELLPGGLPSNLVCITGPSRSADIELQLTIGVHGPRELRIGLL